LNFQTSLPVRTSNAAIQQLTPYSLVAGPRITLSFTTSGATLNCRPFFQSMSVLFQMPCPVFASIAIRWPSYVAQNNRSPEIASPFTTIRYAFDSGGTRYRNVQKLRPVVASSATTSLPWTAYNTPSTTNGVVSILSRDLGRQVHFSVRLPTFSGVSLSRRLYRWLE
jgi:hypothetical protein